MRKQECGIDKIFLTIKLYSTIRASIQVLIQVYCIFVSILRTHLA